MTDSTSLRLNRINAKGLGVANKLIELMAGKEVDLSDLGDPSGLDLIDKKEMRLRAFLSQINQAREHLDTDAYGLCPSCGITFDDGTLDETPWIERCADCVAADNPI